MKGRRPKHTTQRRGKWTFVDPDDRVEDPPKLPRIKGVRWWVEIRRWWASIWEAPWATLYETVDHHGLVMLAMMKQQYLEKPSNALAKEIRYREEQYGLTPAARARLRWAVRTPEINGHRRLVPGETRRQTDKDPRSTLENLN